MACDGILINDDYNLQFSNDKQWQIKDARVMDGKVQTPMFSVKENFGSDEKIANIGRLTTVRHSGIQNMVIVVIQVFRTWSRCHSGTWNMAMLLRRFARRLNVRLHEVGVMM